MPWDGSRDWRERWCGERAQGLRSCIKNRSPNLLYSSSHWQRYKWLYLVKKREFLTKIYGIASWTDAEDFINQLAVKMGKLKKGGEPDVDATAKIVLIDWQRGEIPFYSLPEGEVDKFETKAEGTIDNVKEEDFLQMVGAPSYQLEKNAVL